MKDQDHRRDALEERLRGLPTRRIRMAIEYDGGPFTGWQRQRQGTSVQGALEDAIARAVQHRVRLFGAGRTDAGVHALGMVAHFDTSSTLAAESLARAATSYLPAEISVFRAEEVEPDFDARRDALLRWYRYQIMLTRSARPLGPRAWKITAALGMDKMREALAELQGEHDFAGFRTSGCTAKRTRLNLEEASLSIAEEPCPGSGSRLIALDFKCRSFLQRMVRLMVGCVVGVGAGRLGLADVAAIRDTGKRPHTIRSAPPGGLCLMAIAYSASEEENVLTEHPPPPSF